MHPTEFSFSIPSAEELRKRSGWNRLDGSSSFHAARDVFVAKRATGPVDYRRAYGPPFSEIDLPEDGKGRLKLARTESVTETDLFETVRSVTRSLVDKFGSASSISAGLTAGLSVEAALGASTRTEASHEESLSDTETSAVARTTVKEQSHYWDVELDLPLRGTKFFVPTVWERATYDVYRTHADALVVEYPPGPLGLGHRRKDPRHPGRFNQWPAVPNVKASQRPCFRVGFWTLFQIPFGIIAADEYLEEGSIAAGEVTCTNIGKAIGYPLYPRDIESLYSISQLIPDRYDPNGDWS